jgi:DNA-cytosine methyltransferase
MIRHLDLFSGMGGFALAVMMLGHETIGFCDNDKASQELVGLRWPGVPLHDDIRTLTGAIVDSWGGCDLITGGFPCQPFSVAGSRRGAEDDRSLWPEMARVIDECRPRYVLAENVAGIVSMELDRVLSDLEALGYSARPAIVPAVSVDAKHRRDRVWIMAYADGVGIEGIGERIHRGDQGARGDDHALPSGEHVAHTTGKRLRRPWDPWIWRPAEPLMGGTLDGVSPRLDGLGEYGERSINAVIREVERIEDGPTTYQRTAEVLQALRDALRAQGDGEHTGIWPSQVLLAYVCQLEEWATHKARIFMEGEAASQSEMRSVRTGDGAASAPFGSGCDQQRIEQHPDSMQAVSRLLAHHAEAAWMAYRWKNAGHLIRPWAINDGMMWDEGISRVAHGVPSRVGRLRLLGNGIVPAVAYEILSVMIGEAA